MWFPYKIYLEMLELVCYSVQEITLLINRGLNHQCVPVFFLFLIHGSWEVPDEFHTVEGYT